MSRRSETPQTPLLQVYADEECTIRPQVGQSYNDLWVKVNRTIPSGTDKSWGTYGQAFTTIQVTLPEGGLGSILLYADWSSDDIEGDLEPGVVWCGASEPTEISSPLVVDFY